MGKKSKIKKKQKVNQPNILDKTPPTQDTNNLKDKIKEPIKYLVFLIAHDFNLIGHSLETIYQQIDFNDFEIYLGYLDSNEISHEKLLQDTSIKIREKFHHPKLKKIIKLPFSDKPGKLRNYIFEIFKQENNYEYLIPLDYLDFFYPFSIKRINQLVDKNKPDLISLFDNCANLNSKFLFNQKSVQKYSLKLELDFSLANNKDLPFKLICLNKTIFDFYDKIYDENMWIYDDYLFMLILYKEHNNQKLKSLIIEDNYIYLKNNIISIDYSSIKIDEDSKIKQNLLQEFQIEELDITVLDIKDSKESPLTNLEKTQLTQFYKETSLRFFSNLNYKNSNNKNYQEHLFTSKNILFIDNTSSYSFDTVKTRRLNYIESPIYYFSLNLSKYNKIKVLTKHKQPHTVNENLSYDCISNSDHILENFKPEYIIFQGVFSHKNEYFYRYNPDVKLICWSQHDVTINGIKNFFKIEDLTIDGFIFASQWQKNRYLQQFHLNRDKCFVIKNCVSPTMNYYQQNGECLLKKKKTLLYIGYPNRGLLCVLPLFKELIKNLGELKLIVVSSFIPKLKLVNQKITLENLDELKKDSQYDKFYSSLYVELIQHPNIDFYSEVTENILSDFFKESMVFFYPNTFPEVGCYYIYEAMINRCNIVSSDIASMNEICEGFAYLYNPGLNIEHFEISHEKLLQTPIQIDKVSKNYTNNFINKTIELLKNYESKENQEKLDRARRYVEENCMWEQKIPYFNKILTLI